MDINDDILLRTLSNVVGVGEGSHISITLSVGGFLVSGNLIAPREYFEKLGKFMLAATSHPSPAQKVLANGLTDMGKEIKDEDGTLIDIHDRFVHLRDAQAFHPAAKQPLPTSPGGPGGLWRVRRSAVDAVVIGALAITPDD